MESLDKKNSYVSLNAHTRADEIRERRCEKNWIRRNNKRNKQKKLLPPIPPGINGDLRIYYRDTYNINLFDHKVRRRFNVTSIPNTATTKHEKSLVAATTTINRYSGRDHKSEQQAISFLKKINLLSTTGRTFKTNTSRI
ncbi:hypothetical protein GLOIN_2v1788639 [Rhizophagus irregularis DAOM 181602=DAOM 197198]|uniref:Uncharacterized protein n=1 Tax=Rhizophagus irregularis (strain DAOM 181602 / DAOM 197198 / MUCL 43194) TaxID=747089 RepID=U9UXI8_RHIID|nr:hypothetical protein GLOIN_2v1788639 [Rhizophagus irregularis DAOM 181602=DAOM 197198]